MNNEVNNGQNLSIAALVLGILGIVGGFIPVVCYFTTICAILGIILGVKGRQMSVAATGSASGLATAGLVLGHCRHRFRCAGSDLHRVRPGCAGRHGGITHPFPATRTSVCPGTRMSSSLRR